VCWLEITGKLSLSLLSPGTTYAAYLVFAIAEETYGLECHVGIGPPRATVTVVSSAGRRSGGGGGNGKPPAAVTSTTTATKHNTICLHHMQGEEEVTVHRRDFEYVTLRRRYGPRTRVRPADHDIRCPRRRADGWLEVELGEFAVPPAGDGGGVVEVRFEGREHDDAWKRGLIVQGIDFRPKHA
jgi:hypothetical protein